MEHKHRILIVDDDETAVELLEDLLEGENYQADTALSVSDALEQLKARSYKVMICDLKMPKRSGMELLEEAQQLYPEMQVIMLTAYGTIESAVEALKKGAFDYITKPIQLEELKIVISKAITHERIQTQNVFLKKELEKQEHFLYETNNEELQEIFRTVDSLRSVNSTVLLEGESGTGKEMLARYLHSTSDRASGSFVPINCGAIPESLIESELFGYEKGAFTDAKQRTRGKLEIADGGTLFLDEINELPMKAQVALLRFLQEREVVPLGSHRKVPVNVKIVAATNQDLKKLVDAGGFREDLYYRINVIPLRMPPLRERKEDIIQLAEWFLKHFSLEYNLPKRCLSEDAKEALLAYDWPGNIRELRNSIERATIIARGEKITPDALMIPGHEPKPLFDFEQIGITDLRELEHAYVRWALEKLQGNKSQTARRLGLSVRGLRYKLNNEEDSQ
jgi:DNA-binding NtrC family response regulator